VSLACDELGTFVFSKQGRATASKFISFSGLLHYVRNDVYSKAFPSLRGLIPKQSSKRNEKLKMKNEKYLLSHVILTVGKDLDPKKRHEMLRSSA
jgi:hypothetical protein